VIQDGSVDAARRRDDRVHPAAPRMSRTTWVAPSRWTGRHRVVLLAPSITELVFAIGAGPSWSAAPNGMRYPPEVSQVPSVGDGLSPNVEAVAATQAGSRAALRIAQQC